MLSQALYSKLTYAYPDHLLSSPNYSMATLLTAYTGVDGIAHTYQLQKFPLVINGTDVTFYVYYKLWSQRHGVLCLVDDEMDTVTDINSTDYNIQTAYAEVNQPEITEQTTVIGLKIGVEQIVTCLDYYNIKSICGRMMRQLGVNDLGEFMSALEQHTPPNIIRSLYNYMLSQDNSLDFKDWYPSAVQQAWDPSAVQQAWDLSIQFKFSPWISTVDEWHEHVEQYGFIFDLSVY